MEDGTGTSTYVLIIVILIALSAYFSASEMAFSSLSKTRLKTYIEKGNKKAGLAHKLADKYDKLLSTILIGNNVVNIAVSSIATIFFIQKFGDMGATISTIVITVLVLIFGEITPKSIAKDRPEKFAMTSAPAMNVLMIILTPINLIFSAWKKLIAKIFKLEGDVELSSEELLLLVDEVEEGGSIDASESDLIKNAIEFTECEAEEILTHRVDLVAVPTDATKSEIAKTFHESRFSRLLVYEETIDNIVGVIHQKDFYTGDGITKDEVKDLITPVVFVLQNEKVSSLLRQMQKNKTHVAVVLDEYGGTYGIVTMEDILEELVGEIWDEHEEVIESFTPIAEDTYRADGSIDFDDFCEKFGLKEESEMVSLSGWVMDQLGKIPEEGDKFEFENLLITVVEMDNHRVELVDIREIAPREEEEE
ncbi:MAG: HlyC/CorC family transporter [Clostridiales bacterium]|nr:HlyC/CorC family transporter [Clostridiales bacterium]